MARETAEGQALELDWVQRSAWDLTDDDYREMVVKKTGWYSFITPISIGAIVAGTSDECRHALIDAARELSIAFQIRDDVLNLRAGSTAYGKEANGDLWEGKRTLVLLHLMRQLRGDERRRVEDILARPRISPLGDLFARLEVAGELTREGRAQLEKATATRDAKTEDDILTLVRWIEREGSIEFASRIAQQHALVARASLARARLPSSIHRDVLDSLIDFTIDRDH
jgi:geranylgeranyl diphosphate synthase type II